ncbi:serine hydrolase domain-containing protein [Natronorubrum aibiense]|uniref:serine hydrolase domain-containing protein n=1 Tax=Natronorubrum aibiense TaxID=348826 RepID=UPI001D04BAFC|nr:serine hydrolase domain-containing protein [Natronorubrum aibiense]
MANAQEGTEPTDEATRPLADSDAFEAFLDGVMETHLETYDIAGATVAVVDGDDEFAKGYGYADLEAETPVDAAETLFRTGSVSKLFTWTVAMQAVERGALAIDEDVGATLKAVELPETYDEPITLEHLATHTPGFEERVRGTFVRNESELQPLEEMLQTEQPSRVRPPGEFAAYSNYGSALAGQLVAETAGSSFETVAEDGIFEPLSMERSTFAQPVSETFAGDLSKGYKIGGNDPIEGEFEYVGIPPAGAMSATATDMASFVRAFLQDGSVDDGQILESETVDEMHRRRFGHDERLNGIAFGFYEMSRNGVRVLGHGGDTELFHSLLFLVPDHDVGVFVSYNSVGGLKARPEFVDAFFDRYVPQSEAETPTPNGSPERADTITGTYRSNRIPYTTSEKFTGFPSTITVSVDGEGRLVTEPLGGEATQWVEVEPLLFEDVDGADRLAFRDDDGEITHLFLDSTPVTAFERLSRRESPGVQLGLLAVSLLVLLTAAVGWPLAAGWRRYRGTTSSLEGLNSPLRYARWVAGATSVAFLAFAVAFAAILAIDPTWLLLGDPLRFRLLLAVSLLGAIGTVLTVGLTAWVWYDRQWGLPARLHYTTVAVAGAVLCWVLAYWNLLWYQP